MEQPVICVIVPVYKAEATLPRCIESVLTQQLPGGLRLILVDDQSPDRSGEICDAYAAKDPRVMVLHRRERGVSGARNAGLRAATGEYIVFLDSDDALRPGALAAALAAQAAAPNAFVLWHYTMQPDDTTPVTTVAHPAQQSDLARLHLDCLIAMPWNKLYRRTYAQQLAFDQAYTLGEDLQFVLDYLALLGRCQPDFSYLVLESALTFYDCSRTGTLSTKYHANYCEIWPKHFAKLNPAFKPDGGTVTAANASGINDGAACVVVMSEEKAKELGVKPMATWVAGALGGVDPSIMGVGPVAACKKVFKKTGLGIDDFDLIEANEAFAAQALAVGKELKWDADKVNVNGGAIALGHPVGASGCRILVTLLHEMQKRDAKRGLATLCIGGGMGCATIVEKYEG